MTAPDHLTLRIPVRSARTVPLPRRLADLVVLVRLPSCLAGGASVLLGVHLAGSEAGLADLVGYTFFAHGGIDAIAFLAVLVLCGFAMVRVWRDQASAY